MKIYLSIIIFILSSIILLSQDRIHKNYTTKEGLVQGQVNVIRQDSSGYLWFGTYGGASRWDGKVFMNLTTFNGLTASQVMDIEVGNDGTVYLAPYGGGIILYKDGLLDTLNEENGLSTNWISEIHIQKNGDVLFGGYEGNISLLNEQKLSRWIDPKLLNNKSVWEIYEGKDGTFYIGTYLGGFYKYKDSEIINYTANEGLLDESVWSFSENKNGSIYVGTNAGLHLFKDQTLSPVFYKNQKVKSAVFRILSYNDSTVFFATSDGLLIKNNNNYELLDSKQGLALNELWSMYIEKEGTVFLGTNGNGFNTYKHNLISNYDKKIGLPDNNIWSVVETKENNIIIGTDEGLVILDEQPKIINLESGLTGNNVRCIYYSSEGKLLVGTRNGFNIIDKGIIKQFTIDDGLIDNQIFCIAETENNEIYLGTREGVSVLHKNSIKNITTEDGLVGNYVQSIYVSKNGTMYFGTYGSGISYLKDGVFNHITKSDGLTDNKIQTIAGGLNGEIYIGTYEGGLNILDNGNISKIDVSDGLSSNSIQAIIVGKNNTLYVTTLKSFNIIDFNNGGIPRIRIIDSDDGLASDDCNREATFIDGDDNIWIGTKNGLSKYNSKYDMPITSAPNIYITSIDIFNEPYDFKKKYDSLTLTYDQNYLKLHFTGINLSSPEKMKYKYKLSGIDKEWVNSRTNFVQYTNLDDNEYLFEVKAQNEWGYWSEPAQLSFVITPAWWETWWFYSITTLALIVLVAFIVSYRYKQLLAIEKVRTKISSDLHDNIGSGLTEITFLSEMVKSQVKENENVNKGLNNIADISKTLINDMRDIVWLVNPSHDTLKDLFNRLQDSYQEVLRFSEITLKISGVNNLAKISLPMNYRQHIYLMFKEAINNSIKYSECKNITLDVKTESANLVVEMKDDGKGFEVKNSKNGNGLKNIENRAKQVKGSVSIDSEINKGTFIRFSGKFSKLRVMEI